MIPEFKKFWTYFKENFEHWLNHDLATAQLFLASI